MKKIHYYIKYINLIVRHKMLKVLCVCIIASVLVVSCADNNDTPIKQDDITIKFSDYTAVTDQCGVVCDLGNNLVLTVSPVDDDRYNDECGINIDDRGLWLYPSVASIDINKLDTPTKISFVFTDHCGIGCTEIFLYDKSGILIESRDNTKVSEEETITFTSNLENVRIVAFSTWEGYFKSMTLNF